MDIDWKDLDDLYQIKERYDDGGMGIVYRAYHRAWGIEVAIKHPRAEFLTNHDQIAEFQSECTTWASIGLDPYITTCFYSRDIQGVPCVVSEFLPGGSVQKAIRDGEIYRGFEEECLSRMLTIAASTSWGLMRAHQAKLLHCDIKPGNMLLTDYGTAKIADFGLAVAFRPSASEVKSRGLTISFSSPEQLRGGSLSAASDVWSWAASMLALFMGGVNWNTGSACGAVLKEFTDNGGKAYRIPPMPHSFSELLTECFTFTQQKRLSDFENIAERVCDIHQEVLGDPCPSARPYLDILSADSLNNRAVSRYDLGDLPMVNRLITDALDLDSLHPEANFNAGLLEFKSIRNVPPIFIQRLKQAAQYDLGDFRPWLYLACLNWMNNDRCEAKDCLSRARCLADTEEQFEIERQWNLTSRELSSLALAAPISGEDFAHDSTRFNRLMTKAERAISDGLLDDAKRYLIMSGDIPGFSRNSKRTKLLARINTKI